MSTPTNEALRKATEALLANITTWQLCDQAGHALIEGPVANLHPGDSITIGPLAMSWSLFGEDCRLDILRDSAQDTPHE